MTRLSSFSLPNICQNIGRYKEFDSYIKDMWDREWNELAQNMLDHVNSIDGKLQEKCSYVNYLGQAHQLFTEKFQQQMTQINNEFHTIQQIIDSNSFIQLTVPQILEGHTNEVTGIDICEARNMLASASQDSTVKLWDLQNLQLLKTYTDTDMVQDVAFSSNGNFIAYGGWNKIIRLIDIFDLKKQNEVYQLQGHSDKINRLVFSSDSKYLISGSDDRTVKVWNVETKSRLCQFKTESSVYGVAINNDISLIASNSLNGDINIWNFKDSKLLCTKTNNKVGREIQFSYDQQLLVTCGNLTIKIWSLTELDNGELSLIREFYPSDMEVNSISLTYDSRFIVSNCVYEQQVKVIDTFTGKVIKQYEIKSYNYTGSVAIKGTISMIAYSDGKQITVWKRN